MYRLIINTCLLLSVSLVSAQDDLPQYNLQRGEKFFLKQVMNQNTETESETLQGNVSLDINCNIMFEVEEVTPTHNYLMNCQYRNLELSFFSPQSDISISSRNAAFNPLRSYLLKLEAQTFHVLMSPYGEFIQISELDSIINNFFFEKTYEAERHGLILKTVKEAFGVEALISLGNIAMNVYNDTLAYKIVKPSNITFNAKSIEIMNNLFYHIINDDQLRVQGVGIIQETEDSLELDDMSLVTNLKGNQTYDFLFDRQSGWIIKGISKQKIHSMSVIKRHKELPSGLKIPSFTSSEFQFTGGRISNSK